MTTRDWTPEYRRHLAATDVVEELSRIPGVKRVSIGARMRGGSLVKDMCFHVYVDRKRPASALRRDEVIPAKFRGFTTDVLVEGPEPLERIGFNDENDTRNYPTKVGGIRIATSYRDQGTMGCIAWRRSDRKPVGLTNFHVIFPNKSDQVLSDAVLDNTVDILQVKVGQPKHSKSLCCTCNEIGVVVKVKKRPVDAAIVLLHPDVPFYDKIKNIRRPGGALEQSGVITGWADAVPNHDVFKIGSVTGLTRGTVFEANGVDDIVVYHDTTIEVFLEHGDSGAVLVDTLSGKVVGLLKRAGDWSEGIANARATPIRTVLDALDIDIVGDPNLGTVDVAETDELFELPAESPFAPIAARLRDSRVGALVRELVDAHMDEIIELVNESRPGKVAWQRLHGPAWVAALARSAKEPAYRIPDGIDGMPRAESVGRLSDLLMAHGGEALRDSVVRYGDRLRELLVRHDTVDAMIDAFKRQDPAMGAAATPG
jgi:hypothetical protein